MNTNSNVYTVIYSTVLVVVVAAILAFAAEGLKDKQNENVKLETITKVLTAAAQSDDNFTIDENTDILATYRDRVIDAYFVDSEGKKVGESMNLGKDDLKNIQVASTSDLKKQNDIIKMQPSLSGFQFTFSTSTLRQSQCFRFMVQVFGDRFGDISHSPRTAAALTAPSSTTRARLRVWEQKSQKSRSMVSSRVTNSLTKADFQL